MVLQLQQKLRQCTLYYTCTISVSICVCSFFLIKRANLCFRNLKTLLLERNQLTHLPPELGNVTSITGMLAAVCPLDFWGSLFSQIKISWLSPGLSLRGNPLEYPPADIIEQGVQVILSYLLDDLNASGGMSGMTRQTDRDQFLGVTMSIVNSKAAWINCLVSIFMVKKLVGIPLFSNYANWSTFFFTPHGTESSIQCRPMCPKHRSGWKMGSRKNLKINP